MYHLNGVCPIGMARWSGCVPLEKISECVAGVLFVHNYVYTHFCIGALAGEQKFSIAGGTTFAQDLNCNGMEDHLRDCPRLPLNGSLTACSDPLRSAYIVCQGMYVLWLYRI